MNVVFLGPPGAGKGTQAEVTSKERGMEHVSTGDLLRGAVERGSPRGRKAKEYMEKGLLVPDELVVDIVAERVSRDGSSGSFLFDGFPRNLAQAKALDETLRRLKDRVDVVFYFAVSEEIAVRRLSGRWMCPACGANYHERYIPPKEEGICDRCGKVLTQRQDDKVETVKERLKVYREQTADLIDYYEERGVLRRVDADLSVEETHKEINKTLNSLRKAR